MPMSFFFSPSLSLPRNLFFLCVFHSSSLWFREGHPRFLKLKARGMAALLPCGCVGVVFPARLVFCEALNKGCGHGSSDAGRKSSSEREVSFVTGKALVATRMIRRKSPG